MKCNLYNSNEDLDAVWVSWKEMKEYWDNNSFHPLSSGSLQSAYHYLWLKKRNGELPLFEVGAIHFNHADDSIMFHNGRHRTILLTKFRNDIPLAICDTVKEHEVIRNAIIRPIENSDYIDLPDLPIKRCFEFLDHGTRR